MSEGLQRLAGNWCMYMCLVPRVPRGSLAEQLCSQGTALQGDAGLGEVCLSASRGQLGEASLCSPPTTITWRQHQLTRCWHVAWHVGQLPLAALITPPCSSWPLHHCPASFPGSCGFSSGPPDSSLPFWLLYSFFSGPPCDFSLAPGPPGSYSFSSGPSGLLLALPGLSWLVPASPGFSWPFLAAPPGSS